MNLTLLELNELIYCVGTALKKGDLVNTKVAEKLITKLNDEIEERCELLDLVHIGSTDEGPEYDSAGFTEDDRIVDGRYMWDKDEVDPAGGRGPYSNV